MIYTLSNITLSKANYKNAKHFEIYGNHINSKISYFLSPRQPEVDRLKTASPQQKIGHLTLKVRTLVRGIPKAGPLT
jgi:hypothetical protein